VTARAEHPLDRLLKEVIAEEGGTCRPQEIRDELVGVIERVTAELAAAGEEMAEFCHWTITGGVAVFTFIGEELGIYVVPCAAARQWELVNRFDRMPATDVAAYRARLHSRYGKERPDLVIKPDLAYDWLYGERAAEPADGYTAELWTGELWTTAMQPAESPAPAEPGPLEPAPAVEPAPADEGPAAAVLFEPATEPATGQATGQATEPTPGEPEPAAVEPETATSIERTNDALGTFGGHAEAPAPAEPEESVSTYMGDPLLEQMMAAVRAAGGGKGRPFRRNDLD